MSIYSCNISNVSRAAGSSSCATLSYISGEKVREDRTGELYQYGREERVEYVGTILPENAPVEYRDPSKLFNAIETYEKADNARTAKKIMVALPREFDQETQHKVLEDYIRTNITELGYACTYAIHTDQENHNPHAHILIANRQINEKGEWSTKSRKEYALDEKGERIPLIDPKTGEQKLGKRNERIWKRVSVQVNPLDKKETLQQLRESWAVECNKYLAPDQQIDHRSLAAQGREEEPTIHEGYAARKMEERGEVSERCELNREIRKRNKLLQQIKEALESGWKQLNRLLQVLHHQVSDPAEKAAKELYELRRIFVGACMQGQNPVEGADRHVQQQADQIESLYQSAMEKGKNIKLMQDRQVGLNWYQVKQKKDLQNKVTSLIAERQQDLLKLQRLGVQDLTQAPAAVAGHRAKLNQAQEDRQKRQQALERAQEAQRAFVSKVESIPMDQRKRVYDCLERLKQENPAPKGEPLRMKLDRLNAEGIARERLDSSLKPRTERSITRDHGQELSI